MTLFEVMTTNATKMRRKKNPQLVVEILESNKFVYASPSSWASDDERAPYSLTVEDLCCNDWEVFIEVWVDKKKARKKRR